MTKFKTKTFGESGSENNSLKMFWTFTFRDFYFRICSRAAFFPALLGDYNSRNE